MSASYKGFWIIVGMTVGAVVIAHSTSTPRRSTNYSGSTYNDPSGTSPTFPYSKAGSTPSSPAETTLNPNPTPQPAPTSGLGSSPVTGTTQTRSIDADFKAAFDSAMKVAITQTKAPAPAEPTAGDIEEHLTPPPLETKEIAPQPKIFDEPVAMDVGDENDDASSGDRAVTNTDLNLREGPGLDYLKVETMPKGTMLVILERSSKWWRVRSLSSKAEGWINGTFVSPRN